MFLIFKRLFYKKYTSSNFKIHFRFKNNNGCTTVQKPNKEKIKLPKRYAGSSESVWIEYGKLAETYNPVNLGLGFSDYACPDFVTNALSAVALSSNSFLQQYTRGFGHPRLVKVLSELYGKELNRAINPNTELLVSTGAYEALFCSIIGHVDEGDEVIIIEPFFDCYEPMVKAAGGIPKCIPLRKQNSCSDHSTAADFNLDTKELTALFGCKTKMILINNPQNPIGKVYTEPELIIIADLCKKWDVLCITDEVYEWLVFKPNKHVRIANIPGMWERTITICSAGKTFCITGWKIGWAIGPDYLIHNLIMVHQNCIDTCNTPIQEAIAISFEHEMERYNCKDSYLVTLAATLEEKRDYLVKALIDAGMKPILPHGGFFIVADWSPLEAKANLTTEKDEYKDFRFTKWMTKKLGLQGIPVSAFYSKPHKKMGEYFVRYCHYKKQETLEASAKILKEWKIRDT